jgi:hypothetical protein
VSKKDDMLAKLNASIQRLEEIEQNTREVHQAADEAAQMLIELGATDEEIDMFVKVRDEMEEKLVQLAGLIESSKQIRHDLARGK